MNLLPLNAFGCFCSVCFRKSGTNKTKEAEVTKKQENSNIEMDSESEEESMDEELGSSDNTSDKDSSAVTRYAGRILVREQRSSS